MRKRIAITGMGAVTPLGIGAAALFDGWRAGRCAVGGDGFGRARDFEPTDHFTKKEARRSDRFTQLALVAAAEAMAQAGWTDGLPADSNRIGAVLGTAYGGLGTLESQTTKLVREEGGLSPLGISLAMPNAASGVIALRHGLHGPAHGAVSTCVAGTEAIGSAARLIATGDADAMVAGGAEAPLAALAMALADHAGVLSESGVPRPFDARRDGLVLGEAAGILILEDYELAQRRGATVYAELLGYGATSDAEPSAGRADPRGPELAIGAALRDAGVEPREVAYVNAHGASTELHDPIESRAIERALGEHAREVPVSATKSAIGHALGAAGAAEAVATVMALRERVAPPTVGHERPGEGLELNYVPGEAQPLAGGRAVGLSNSFGFGGQNAVLCLAA